jgi:8-oxo-dGTP pyrophosphatase MutT (NUDIX family)
MTSLWQDLRMFLQPNNSLAYQTGLYPSQASVLILFTDDPHNPDMIFTLRARHLSSHPGEVAFPGGMWEPSDASLLNTALRETQEEIGLAPSAVNLLGACPPRSTRAGVRVTPFVGVVPAATEFSPNLTELDAVFRVPVSAFHSGVIQTRTDLFSYDGKSYRVPAYLHQGFEIWGFTAALTSEIISAIVAEQDPVTVNK